MLCRRGGRDVRAADRGGDRPGAGVAHAADGATDVAPSAPLEITVTDGELDEVTVVDGDAVQGAVEDGAEEAAPDVWVPETPLAYGASYTVSATATNEADEEATATTTFTTVTPETVSTPGIGPLDGTTVGVGMPIRVHFDDPVTDKAAVESHLEVASSTPTDGVWSWFSDTEVHFRPSEYRPENIDVTLDAELYGVDFGGGVWGEKNRTVNFSIGERHVSVASTYQMQVYDGDQLVRPSRSAPGAPTSRAATARTWSSSSTATASWTPAPTGPGRQPGWLPDAGGVRRPHLQER